MNIPFISGEYIDGNTHYQELIDALRTAFQADKITVPPRHHHQMDDELNTTLLLMPAWAAKSSFGVKLVNIFPQNTDLPSINGLYIHFDGKNGQPLCIIDAKALTTKRTAATSALASQLLSRPDSHSLLVLGTGAMAPELIQAHTSVRPIKQVYVWGRDLKKAEKLCNNLMHQTYSIAAVPDYNTVIHHCDIISCATMSPSPLLHGHHLSPGQHIDLVGSYLPHMREADDDVIHRASIYVDTIKGATKESGDLYIPLKEGTISDEDILQDLYGMCSGTFAGRPSEDEITLFKSVGYALEDLVGGEYFWNKYLESHA
jgi:ornithine cyclodeaminase